MRTGFEEKYIRPSFKNMLETRSHATSRNACWMVHMVGSVPNMSLVVEHLIIKRKVHVLLLLVHDTILVFHEILNISLDIFVSLVLRSFRQWVQSVMLLHLFYFLRVCSCASW